MPLLGKGLGKQMKLIRTQLIKGKASILPAVYRNFPTTVPKAKEEMFFTRGFPQSLSFDSVLPSLALCPDNLSLSSPGFFSQTRSISFHLVFEKGLFLGFTQLTMKWFVGVEGKTKQTIFYVCTMAVGLSKS